MQAPGNVTENFVTFLPYRTIERQEEKCESWPKDSRSIVARFDKAVCWMITCREMLHVQFHEPTFRHHYQALNIRELKILMVS